MFVQVTFTSLCLFTFTSNYFQIVIFVKLFTIVRLQLSDAVTNCNSKQQEQYKIKP